MTRRQRERSSEGALSSERVVRLVHVTTIPGTLIFIEGQIGFMKARGLEVTLVSSPGEDLAAFGRKHAVPVFGVSMARQITPLADLRSLHAIWRHFRRLKPDIVHSHTPKAGLLGTLGAWLAGVPVRVYSILGLRYMTASGPRRVLLKTTERIACALANHVLCVSHSMRQVAITDRLCPDSKLGVLRSGTPNGVDAADRFDPVRLIEEGAETRRQYGIPAGALVVGFVGRVVRDKGIVELVEAWKALRQEFPSLHLLVVGPFESYDPLPPEVVKELHDDPRVHLLGYQADPAPLYAAMDMVVLPTYREGFGMALIEAGAMALPVVATRVPGCIDAVQEGITGTLVPPRNSQMLAEAIRTYLCDAALRHRHGWAGRERALREFRPEALSDAMHREYLRLLSEKGVTLALDGPPHVPAGR